MPTRNHLHFVPALASFSGEADDLCVQEWLSPGEPTGVDRGSPDLVGMARWAMHYLVCNPQKRRGYECRFGIRPLSYPPAPGDEDHDPVSPGDTEARMELEFVYMREMSGLTVGQAVEEGIRSRLLSYIREDGLCWCSPYSAGAGESEDCAIPWTTGHLLRSTAELYGRTGDESLRALGRRLVQGLKSLATRRGDLAWYEGGMAGWRDGKWLEGCSLHYPSVADPLVHYWRATGDDEALAFAEAVAEGIVAGVQASLEGNRIGADGSHNSPNCHLTMRAVLGVGEVGQATGNARLVEWARQAYEFTRSIGTDWGWVPENRVVPAYECHSETCGTGDMVELAATLAQTGYPEYWDHVERAVRNYLPEAQFFLTDPFVELYRARHAEQDAAQIDAALVLLRKFEGGFLARQTANDWVYPDRNGNPDMNMMGCCPPEGMRSLYVAWANTVVERDGDVYVNMALDRDAPAARVTAHAPRQGRIEIDARKAGTYHLRPPSWAPREQVRVTVNGQPVEVDWRRSNVCLRDVRSGDRLRMDYPLPRFTQRLSLGRGECEERYQVQWLGNDVHEVSPRGQFLPIFTGARRGLPELPDPNTWEDGPTVNIRGGAVVADEDRKPDGQ